MGGNDVSWQKRVTWSGGDIPGKSVVALPLGTVHHFRNDRGPSMGHASKFPVVLFDRRSLDHPAPDGPPGSDGTAEAQLSVPVTASRPLDIPAPGDDDWRDSSQGFAHNIANRGGAVGLLHTG